jgi:hypothetical protein
VSALERIVKRHEEYSASATSANATNSQPIVCFSTKVYTTDTPKLNTMNPMTALDFLSTKNSIVKKTTAVAMPYIFFMKIASSIEDLYRPMKDKKTRPHTQLTTALLFISLYFT